LTNGENLARIPLEVAGRTIDEEKHVLGYDRTTTRKSFFEVHVTVHRVKFLIYKTK
jgi:hypothetical protein